MILAWLLLLTGLTISAVAIYYSVVGLAAIFAAASVPIIIMGTTLEVAKLVCATWIKQYWTQVPRLMKTYMVTAVTVLMLITSMGIFGFLSKAHNDQNLVSGDVQSKIAIYDEKIKTAKENIEADRKQLKQMDEAVDQVMGRSTDEKGADKANAIRKSQAKDRAALAKDIEANQKLIAKLNDEAAPIRAEVRKVEAEVGPIKYIAKFIYGEDGASENMLEKAVTWIIILIVIVFDPLAVIMLLGAQMTFAWHRKGHDPLAEETEATETPTATPVGFVAQEVSEVTPEAKSGGYGNTVVVTRPDGTRVRYAHLSSLNVNPGDTINRDTVYGASGSTGKSTGEHLHYEILAPNKPNSELPKESRGNEPTKFVTSGPVYRQAQQQNPNLINEALAVLNGQKQMPSGMGANNYHNRALTNLVFEMDPNFNTQSYKTTQQFTTGKQGDVVRSMNVAIDHLDTLQRAAIDLNNNNFPAVNRILNPLQSAFGYPEVTSFDGIKSIVGSEVAKATTGGNMALGDREEIRQVLDNWKSPKQTSDVISKLQQLLGGQLKGLRTQYQAGGGKDFDKFLAPRTKQVLGTEEIPENKPMTPAEKARAEQDKQKVLQGLAMVKGYF